MTTPHYTRLPGKGPRREGFFSMAQPKCTLWLANDHLLNVDRRAFSEEYKRFYFQDIQAFILQRTRRGMYWNVVYGFLTALSLGLLIFLEQIAESRLFFLVTIAILSVSLLINWWQGPTCRCQIVTGVQQDTLPSLDRLRVTEAVLHRMQPLIQNAQTVSWETKQP